MKKLLFENTQGWKIYKDSNFPSTNYIVYNVKTLSISDAKRVNKGYLPIRNIAYYGTYKNALARVYNEIMEGND